MTVETLKSLIEHEFDRVNNISEFKSEVFRLIDLYDKENKKVKSYDKDRRTIHSLY